MKKYLFICLSVLIIGMTQSCNNASNDEIVADQSVLDALQNKKESELNEKSEKKVGEWVEKGIECYGIVITTVTGDRTVGKSVKCKVVAVKENKIKLKAIENINLMESAGCNQLGISFGETWWETEADVYQTREDADKYLLDKNWLIK